MDLERGISFAGSFSFCVTMTIEILKILTHWGQGPMETSEHIVNTLKALVRFTQPFPTRYILGTFEMLLCYLPNMLSLITFKMVVQMFPKYFQHMPSGYMLRTSDHFGYILITLAHFGHMLETFVE